MPQDFAIKIDGLEIIFDQRAVLRDFSLRLAKGEKLLLQGPSGSGKSTILLCVMGFLKPASGDIYIENHRLSGGNVWQLRRKMVWVAQEPELGDQTVREVIERPFAYRANQHLQDNLQRLEHYMEMFALSRSVLKNSARTLSGGEKQRVALITAVLLERPIILLDEPSSALDPTSKQAVMDFISRAKQSILTVSHDRQWQSCADRVQDI